MKFRILEIDKKFYVQQRVLFMWFHMENSSGASPAYESLEEAQFYIDKYVKGPDTKIHYYEPKET